MATMPTDEGDLSTEDPPHIPTEVLRSASGGGASMTSMELTVVSVIGTVGMVGNGLVLLVLLRYKASRQRISNLLIINQSLVDLITSFLLVVTYVSKSYKKSYSGSRIIICLLIDSDVVVWVFMCISTICLTIITFERYLMIVYPTFYRNNVKHKALLMVIVATWIIVAIFIGSFNVPFSGVIDGVCYIATFWPSVELAKFYSVFSIMLFFLAPVTIFIACYGHMLIVLRKKAKVLPSQSGQAQGDKSNKLSQAQLNLTKVMVIVSVCFVICWGPVDINYLLTLMNVLPVNLGISQVYKALTFLTFCNCSINPLVYAFKYNDFKNNLKRMVFGKKVNVASTDESTFGNSSTV